jgi:hypothetical protein
MEIREGQKGGAQIRPDVDIKQEFSTDMHSEEIKLSESSKCAERRENKRRAKQRKRTQERATKGGAAARCMDD